MKKIALYIMIAVSLTACKKVLEKEDLTGVGDEVWDNESTATLYLNRCYSVAMPTWPANAGTSILPFAANTNTTDDYNTTGLSALLTGTLAVDGINDFGTNNTTGAWFNIRRINVLLNDIDHGALSQTVKTKIKAQAYFLRAYMYFSLVKLYGGVPYVAHPQDWVAEDLNVARSKTTACIDSICRDLDSAALSPYSSLYSYNASSGDRGRITKEAAMAMKGRVLLFAASKQFNPSGAGDKWERAYQANKAAYDMLTSLGYALFPSYSNVLLDKSASNKEVILIRSFDGSTTSGNYNSYENAARPSSEGNGGGYQPTWNLVEAYPMKNGKSIDASTASYPYELDYFWKNRDPRFDATIAFNGVAWALSGQPARKQWIYTGTNSETALSATGFYSRKGVNTSTSKTNAQYGNTDWVEMRLAEVMMNLAECANHTARQSEAYDLLKLIRSRAGITDEDGNYGITASMSVDDMDQFILNERRIEFAFEGKRNDDLRRTKSWTLLNGTYRQAITIDPVEPYFASSDTSTAEKKLNNLNYMFKPGVYMRDTLDVNSPNFTQFFKVTIKNLDNTSINYLDAYYFFPIPPSALGKSNNLAQTQGWPNGTFDPLN